MFGFNDLAYGPWLWKWLLRPHGLHRDAIINKMTAAARPYNHVEGCCSSGNGLPFLFSVQNSSHLASLTASSINSGLWMEKKASPIITKLFRELYQQLLSSDVGKLWLFPITHRLWQHVVLGKLQGGKAPKVMQGRWQCAPLSQFCGAGVCQPQSAQAAEGFGGGGGRRSAHPCLLCLLLAPLSREHCPLLLDDKQGSKRFP